MRVVKFRAVPIEQPLICDTNKKKAKTFKIIWVVFCIKNRIIHLLNSTPQTCAIKRHLKHVLVSPPPRALIRDIEMLCGHPGQK